MLSRLFKKRSAEPEMVIVHLNAKLQPVHRGEFFEDPLNIMLMTNALGEVSGGGTMQAATGEIEYCDIELSMRVTAASIEHLVSTLEALGVPKGSKILVETSGAERDIGHAEGIAIYLNGTTLPDEVYRSCDSNFVYSELDRLLDGTGRVLSFWQGPTETAFYMYGSSFDEMRGKIAPLLESYPLCEGCRIARVA